MIFNIPLSHDFDHYCEKIDEHIREDFETKVPDYGAEAFAPLGFHFRRKDRRIRGIYRSKKVKNTGHTFLSPSTHMHFSASMGTDKKGERVMRVFMWPQLTQMFMLVVSLAFIILFAMNIADTYVYVALFAAVFLYSLIETVRLTALVKREFREFFK